jgi:hypothetical protein
VAAYIKRADRRPQGWDLPVHNTIHSTIHNLVHTDGDGVHTLHPVASHGVQTRPHGVQTTTSRGCKACTRTVP